MERRKTYYCEGITSLDGQIMRKVENDRCKYLGIDELDRVKEQEVREQCIKEYMKRLKLQKQNAGNKNMGGGRIVVWGYNCQMEKG